jgi:Pyruvate/2-oxoacid:ferredoxin oxidoreductase delta subunit
MKPNNSDIFLEERLTRYDAWVREGKIPFSSKVIPVRESIEAKQWVIPTEQVLEFLRNARSFAVTHCVCRSHYGHCDNPTEVCFPINDDADLEVAQGSARHLSLEEAETLLRHADERGLVHLTVYDPHQYVYAICSCCTCCCHDLQFLQKLGRVDLVARSEYVAQTDMDTCIHCGDCIERCVFEARVWEGDQMRYDADACYGCGLCVTICPVGATVLERRQG